MKDERLSKRSETEKQEGCRKRGRPQLRWEDCVKRDLRKRKKSGQKRTATGSGVTNDRPLAYKGETRGTIRSSSTTRSSILPTIETVSHVTVVRLSLPLWRPVHSVMLVIHAVLGLPRLRVESIFPSNRVWCRLL